MSHCPKTDFFLSLRDKRTKRSILPMSVQSYHFFPYIFVLFYKFNLSFLDQFIDSANQPANTYCMQTITDAAINFLNRYWRISRDAADDPRIIEFLGNTYQLAIDNRPERCVFSFQALPDFGVRDDLFFRQQPGVFRGFPDLFFRYLVPAVYFFQFALNITDLRKLDRKKIPGCILSDTSTESKIRTAPPGDGCTRFSSAFLRQEKF